LLDPIILDKTFSYHANSNVDLTDDQAFNQVPFAAGSILTIHALYLFTIEYGTDLFLFIGTINMFL
jgi:hypothetical protein